MLWRRSVMGEEVRHRCAPQWAVFFCVWGTIAWYLAMTFFQQQGVAVLHSSPWACHPWPNAEEFFLPATYSLSGEEEPQFNPQKRLYYADYWLPVQVGQVSTSPSPFALFVVVPTNSRHCCCRGRRLPYCISLVWNTHPTVTFCHSP